MAVLDKQPARCGHYRFARDQLNQYVADLRSRPGRSARLLATAEQIRELLTKGALGGSLFFTTEDCRATYADLSAKGVEFIDEPTEREYGIDCGLRDPFGNAIRFSQPLPAA